MGSCIIVPLRGVPVVDQQAVLIREVIHIVLQIWVVQVSEEVWSSLQALIITVVLSVFEHIVLVLQGGFRAVCHVEASGRLVGPARISFSPISWESGDVDIIHHKAEASRVGIGPVAEAQKHITSG